MKTSTLFGATLCTFLAAGAHAQSSVAIYGFVDVGIRHVNNSGVGSITSEASGGYRTSRLGFRGTEDLGGGTFAGFKLEAAVGADTGTAGSTTVAGQFFNRGSYVELGNKSYGTVRLGLDLNPTYVTWFENDPWYGIGMGSAGNLFNTTQNGPLRSVFGPVSNTETTTFYTRNMVQYFSPNVGGFFGVVAYAPREGALSSAGAAQQAHFRLGYNAGGPFKAAISRATSHAQVVAAGPVSLEVDTDANASYDFGPVKLAAAWRQFKADTSKQNNYFLAATIPLHSGNLQGWYGRSKMSGTVAANLVPGTSAGSIDRDGAAMWVLGYQYFLSKRTTLYTTAAHLSNHGHSFLSLPGGPAVTIANFAGHTSTGYEVGISHAF
ncbi:MAG TPA: porin [Ramlibacter sp.]|uniref:porin n=1 Tax=Ramlibacter sp. TaxID=1917967 RepID=UPI002BCEE94D|nr:porin [Ramlibacter sp.]HVZ45826.1 porin [Ramlibacter sp.]